MPDYLKRVGRDTTDDTIIRTSEAEKTLSRVRGPASKRLGIDRGSIPSVAAPLEGQMMVQYADEAVGTTPVAPEVGSTFKGESPYYFANQKWRPFSVPPSDLAPTYGLYQTATETIAAGGASTLSWEYVSGAVVLDLTTPTAPTVLAQGVYAVMANIEIVGGVLNVDRSIRGLLQIGFGPFAEAFGVTQGDATTASPEFCMTGLNLMLAGSSMNIQINNKDSVSRDIRGFNMGVLKLFEY